MRLRSCRWNSSENLEIQAQLSKTRILISGATGFVGKHLLGRLESIHDVWALNRRRSGHRLEILQDLDRPFELAHFPPKVDLVIHAAGVVGESQTVIDHCVNVDGTRRLLEYAVHAGAKRFVLLSTGGVYQSATQPLREDSAVLPVGDYARSKMDAELIARTFYGKIRVLVARLFFPYGPSQQGRVIPRLVELIERGEPVPLNNLNGEPRINPIYITDLVELLVRLMENFDGGIVNLAGPEVASIRELAKMIGEILERTPSFRIVSERGELSRIGDTTLARNLTNYSPTVGLR